MSKTARKAEPKRKKQRFYASWWVVVVIGSTLLYHAYSTHTQSLAYHQLEGRVQELAQQKAFALQSKEELLLEIQSQQDPAWVEMVLMKGLGVVPEGARKVYFTEE